MYREAELPCPECGISLVAYPGRDKHRCVTCGGVLAGAGELAIELSTALASSRAARPRSCPRCGGEMRAIDVGPLALDRCEADGAVWFDRGELGRLTAALADPAEGWAQSWANFVRLGL